MPLYGPTRGQVLVAVLFGCHRCLTLLFTWLRTEREEGTEDNREGERRERAEGVGGAKGANVVPRCGWPELQHKLARALEQPGGGDAWRGEERDVQRARREGWREEGAE